MTPTGMAKYHRTRHRWLIDWPCVVEPGNAPKSHAVRARSGTVASSGIRCRSKGHGESRAGRAGRSLLERLTGRTLVSVAGVASATRQSRPGPRRARGRVAPEAIVNIDVIVTVELGDTSYLLVSEGEAVLVDPQRDAWRFVAAAEARHATIRYVVETHVHNDYVSGALEARAATGADIVAPAGGGYAFAHRALEEGDELKIGGVTLTAWHTPGHTPEHMSYVVREGGADDPVAVFTGGSLIVGAAGRSDLL